MGNPSALGLSSPPETEALLALSTLYRNERWHLLFRHARPAAHQNPEAPPH